MSTCTKIMGAGLTGLLLGAGGCPFEENNPGHCASNEGDASCERLGDGSRPYCRRGTDECITAGSEHGCVAERPDDACYSPCGGRSTIAENGACVMEESSSSSGSETTTGTDSTTTGSESTTGTTPCAGPEDCPDPDAPFCNDAGLCVPCNQAPLPAQADALCAALDPAAPLCSDDGRCVTCSAERTELCDAMQLACDDASGTCGTCEAHDQCQPAACNLLTGACLPKDEVVHVGPGQDYATLFAAVSSFTGAGEQGTIIVHQGDYNESATVATDRVLAFLAADGELPRWVRTSGAAPQLSVTTGATAILDGLQLSGNANDVALVVTSGRAWLDRSRVVQNAGGGIRAQNAAELVLRNCFVGGNGVGGPGSFGINVDDSDARILYSTVARNDEATFDSMRCTSATVDVRNSVIVGRDASSIDCPGIMISQSALDQAIGTNINVGPANLAWFTNGTGGDFHFTPAGAKVFADIAEWQQGDPLTDIDGDLRPTTDASPDYAGADVPL